VRRNQKGKCAIKQFCKNEETAMIIVMGYAKLGAGELDRLDGEMKIQVAATNAEAGCQTYSFSRDVSEPDRLVISERWDDQIALDAHFATPHMAAFNAVLGAAQVLAVDVKSYNLETGEIRQLIGG
jgi:quinol monooxygenase YgiN